MEKKVKKYALLGSLIIVLFTNLLANRIEAKPLSYSQFDKLSVDEKVSYINNLDLNEKFAFLKSLIFNVEVFSIPPNSEIKLFPNGEVYIGEVFIENPTLYGNITCYRGLWKITTSSLQIQTKLNVKLQEYYDIINKRPWVYYTAHKGPEDTYTLEFYAKGDNEPTIWIVSKSVSSDGILKCMKDAGTK